MYKYEHYKKLKDFKKNVINQRYKDIDVKYEDIPDFALEDSNLFADLIEGLNYDLIVEIVMKNIGNKNIFNIFNYEKIAKAFDSEGQDLIKIMPKEDLEDKYILSIILKYFPKYYMELKDEFKNDFHLIRIAVSKCGDNLGFVPKEILQDEDIYSLTPLNTLVLKYADAKFKYKVEFMEFFCKRNGLNLEFVPEVLKTKKICEIALKEDISVFKFLSDAKKEQLFNKYFEKNKEVLLWGTTKQLSNMDYIKEYCIAKINCDVLSVCCDEIKNDKEKLLEIAKKMKENGIIFGEGFYKNLKNEFKFDKEFILKLSNYLKFDGVGFNEEFKKDKEFVLKLIKTNPLIIRKADNELLKDLNFLMTAFKNMILWNKKCDETNNKHNKVKVSEIIREIKNERLIKVLNDPINDSIKDKNLFSPIIKIIEKLLIEDKINNIDTDYDCNEKKRNKI